MPVAMQRAWRYVARHHTRKAGLVYAKPSGCVDFARINQIRQSSVDCFPEDKPVKEKQSHGSARFFYAPIA
jgi:hypothetical protein